jgi:hypothetical protein
VTDRKLTDPAWRFPSAAKRDEAVQAWFAAGPAELRGLARRWFDRMRECGSDTRELIHDGCPVACAGEIAFAYVNAFKAHVNVGFFNGAALLDANGLLEGTGKRMRHVKLRPDGPVDSLALGRLIAAAYADAKSR